MTFPNARHDCRVCLAGETRSLPCRTGKPGIRPGGRPAFLLRQKSGAKKATPMMAVRAAPDCTRRQYRNREASELATLRQPTLLIRFRHWRRVAIYGDLLQLPLQLQQQLQRSLRGANYNCNCRYAGNCSCAQVPANHPCDCNRCRTPRFTGSIGPAIKKAGYPRLF